MRSPLRRARALISDPKRWTTWVEARDTDGVKCPAEDPCATQFCAIGALYKAKVDSKYDRVLDAAAELLDATHAAALNDTHNHDEVLWMFDLAIAMDEVGA